MNRLIKALNRFKDNIYIKIRRTLYIENLYLKTENLNQVSIEAFIQSNLFNNQKYNDEARLNKYEYQSFSQFGEDGIIEEIFKRIGVTNSFFVEFGVETGIETNTTFLLFKNWSGLWIDGSMQNIQHIHENFAKSIKQQKLKAVQSFITAENIEDIFNINSVPTEFDLLSIDIDRNDFYVWKAIDKYKPRVIIVEYNAVFKPPCEFVVDYDALAVWDKTSNHGASLESLYKLGLEKGYCLVGCCFAGVNAFFVRKDIAEKYFKAPFTASFHYETPKYFLYNKNGHPRNIKL